MTAAVSGARTETVTGTIMFTDIVGFTEFNALRGDEEALDVLAVQERIVREALSNQGSDARIVKELGDGLMLWFFDPCAAIETGLALQERFEHEAMEGEAPLWVRIGVHTGRQSRRGDDLVGHDVNVASRIMSLAGSGEVLASAATVEASASRLDDVRFDELGPVLIRGIPSPIRLFRVERG